MPFRKDVEGKWVDERGSRIYAVEGQLKTGQQFRGFSYTGVHGGEVSLTLYNAEFMAGPSMGDPYLSDSARRYSPDDEVSIPHTSLSWVAIMGVAADHGRAGAELGIRQFGMDRGGGLFGDE
jgi:hypothetical protein